ncbi:hypothetical protein [Candidatus Thiosymbion oneisti]|uniref:hypothetical protein n=1 Tax=Candidatus Thiosymbion oneisti TaxID=589554 RepID=UPI0010603A76|nr:hypothetical protein [Candidatus Thiosymbion oneisti]
MGIRSTRITEMFRGRIPTAGALVIVHWTKGVCTDWLPTGDGVPFCVRHLTDQNGNDRITEFLDRSDLPGLPHEEAALLRAYRAQSEHKQAARRALLDVEPQCCRRPRF